MGGITYTTIKMSHKNNQHPPRNIWTRINTLKRYTLSIHIQHWVVFDLFEDVLGGDGIIDLNVLAVWACRSIISNVVAMVGGAISGAVVGEFAVWVCCQVAVVVVRCCCGRLGVVPGVRLFGSEWHFDECMVIQYGTLFRFGSIVVCFCELLRPRGRARLVDNGGDERLLSRSSYEKTEWREERGKSRFISLPLYFQYGGLHRSSCLSGVSSVS